MQCCGKILALVAVALDSSKSLSKVSSSLFPTDEFLSISAVMEFNRKYDELVLALLLFRAMISKHRSYRIESALGAGLVHWRL